MYAHQDAGRPPVTAGGTRQTPLTSWQDGLWLLSLARVSIAPGAATPLQRHFCEKAIFVLSGCGELHVEDTVQRFGPDCTLVVPLGADHRIVNTGAAPLTMLAAYSAASVETVNVVDAPVAAAVPAYSGA